MNTRQIRRALGLVPSGHLPPEGMGETVVEGRLFRILTAEDAATKRPGAHRPHRIEERCCWCDRWFPAGRMAQHKPACPESGKIQPGGEYQ